MNYLLFGGAPATGKTSGITRITRTLINVKGFVVISGTFPPLAPHIDFRIILEGFDSNKTKIRIYINSATDTKKIIQDCKKYHDLHQPVHIIISSVRDIFSIRTDFFSIMKINNTIDYICEIPLGKVRRGKHRVLSLNWYETKIDKIVIDLLEATPFNL